jgi:cytochrome c peroxidase
MTSNNCAMLINTIIGSILCLILLLTNFSREAFALPDDYGSITSLDYLNHQLEKAITSNSPNGQLDYFILPESSNLSSIPTDPKNPITPDKVKLGKMLFHETALTINPSSSKYWQQASCASCHFAEGGFRSNVALALGTGGLGWNKSRRLDPDSSYAMVDKQRILTPSILNGAFQNVMLWDGRAGSNGPNKKNNFIRKTYINRYNLDGLETQAIDALSVHRMGMSAIADMKEYQDLFSRAFPERPYISSGVEDLKSAGLAIAAYERTVLSTEAPFQKWLKGDKKSMSHAEVRGAITFFNSSCIKCHTGPNLAKNDFYSVGFDDHPKEIGGLNLGRSSVTRLSKDDFKFKVSQLYNLADSSPYGHGASFNSIREVVDYFNTGKPQKLATLYSKNLSVWFKPLQLNELEVDDLTTFLTTGLRDPNLTRYVPKSIPSGLCFPNNDLESKKQLGCS